MAIDERLSALLYERARRRKQTPLVDQLTAEWFPEEAEFFDSTAQLAAANCGRRAGKTRGLCRDLMRDAVTIPGARLLYLNSTRGEAERLAWYGNRNDGVASLVQQYGIDAKLDQSRLSVHVHATDAWIYLRGADDEAELRKALGGAYHKVYFDEAQKIPPKLATSIREVFFPALLDFGGKFRMTGTPVRQMSGLFYDVTRPEKDQRAPGWKVFEWNLLANPFFGKTLAERTVRGVEGLQSLYGGADAAPIDSPIMQREAFGRWVREDAAYVYAVHRVPREKLLYAPARVRADGFPDIPAALKDLPWPWREGLFAMGIDIGWYPDPFAFVLWGWHGRDPRLYEVASWRKNYLTSDQQNDAIKAVREHLAIGILVADASNPAKPAVKGWSKEWVERYQQPIIEAEKQHKHVAIDVVNSDILGKDRDGNSLLALRDGSDLTDGGLYEEMAELQWSMVASATGRLVEDPTLANDLCDAGLYGHRHSYSFRWRPEDEKLTPGTDAWANRERQQLEEAIDHDEEDEVPYH